jgi:asparagine synthase (glutamine-hydrolysing)
MCGIAGLFYFQPQEIKKEEADQYIQSVSELIHHRGPDDVGSFAEDLDRGVLLAFRRLSIIDLNEGHQPLCNVAEDKSIWIVFNGEIYNYKQLRNELKARGHQFTTESDTEVIVHLYEEYGVDCVRHLRGMFGFAIWDRRKQMLFGARDHFGIKPFYYHLDESKFVFGSEIKSILAAPGIERKVHSESLLQYLTFQYVPQPSTMFAGIQKLPHGHYFTLTRDGHFEMQQYWDPQFTPEDRSMDDLIEELRTRLQDSVEHHMQSDVPRGCFLSSGIDSTAIAAYMRRIEPIKTFSVGFEGENNEAVISSDTALKLGTEHYAKMISERDFFDAIPNAVWYQDEPVADPSAIALYHVAQLAQKHVKVVLSGEGADEMFGGYRVYREPNALRPVSWLPESIKQRINRMADALPEKMYGRNYLLRATTPLEQRFFGNAKIFTADVKSEILSDTLSRVESYMDAAELVAPYYERTKDWDPVSRMQYIDMHFWMPGDILMKADKMTMAHSLELRVPFLDKELFEIVRKIPAKYRIAEGTTKTIFRKAMDGIVPETILHRPKLGFPVPLRDWLRTERASQLLEQIKGAGIEAFFNMQEVEKMVAVHRAGQADHARKIWVIYMFAMWHSTYITSNQWRREVVRHGEI